MAAPPLAIHSSAAGDVLHIRVGRSVVLTSTAPLRRVYVGNPAVLQTFTSGLTEVVLTAKSAGVSSLVIWDEAGGDRLYAVFVDIDPQTLCDSLAEAFPGSSIHAVAGEGKIFLSGSVPSEAASDAAFKMASQYAKEVINSLQVVSVHARQVQLKLRIIEVDRSRLDQLGINLFLWAAELWPQPPRSSSPARLQGLGLILAVSDPLNIFLYNAKLNVGLTSTGSGTEADPAGAGRAHADDAERAARALSFGRRVSLSRGRGRDRKQRRGHHPVPALWRQGGFHANRQCRRHHPAEALA